MAITSATKILERRYGNDPEHQIFLEQSRAENRAVDELEKWNLKDFDAEISHSACDDILLEYLDVVAPEVSAKYREVREKVGFWYA